MITTPGPEEHIYSPSELNNEAKRHIEAGFGRVWIKGEISNLAKPSSGHQYFTLKDAQAHIRCALFKQNSLGLAVELNLGDEVLVYGQVSLYAARGDYQLIASSVFSAGVGDLHAQFEQLKKQLASEGLFDDANKKPIPKWPSQIAIVTSSSGAALRDIQKTLAKRWPVAKTKLYPSAVQGTDAPKALIHALKQADMVAENDVIILARGGGSLEDLWSFNDELLARTVASMTHPVITGVGHETDTTMVDFVSDLRAPTPTAAAMLATPDMIEVIATLDGLDQRIRRAMERWLNQADQGLDLLERRLLRTHPQSVLQRNEVGLAQLYQRLVLAQKHQREKATQALVQLSRSLDSLSPLNVLSRGYGVVTDEFGNAFDEHNPPKSGQKLRATLEVFEITASIDSVARPKYKATS